MLLPISYTQPSEIFLPGSKSISNRVLLLSALSKNACHIKRLLKSDDTDRMLDALAALGVSLDKIADDELIIHGTNGVKGCGSCTMRLKVSENLGWQGSATMHKVCILKIIWIDIVK